MPFLLISDLTWGPAALTAEDFTQPQTQKYHPLKSCEIGPFGLWRVGLWGRYSSEMRAVLEPDVRLIPSTEPFHVQQRGSVTFWWLMGCGQICDVSLLGFSMQKCNTAALAS